jgi:hypothetical protein
MKEHLFRVRIPYDLYIRYKVLCAERNLSMPKQTHEILKKFVEIQEENKKQLKGS